jgi:radical SAM protein with 4Fe4S-binding SPASM domain
MGEHLDALFARATARQIPLDVAVELTHRCTFACRHCYLGAPRATTELPTDRLLALFDELAGLGTLYLTFSGGEPLLREDWEFLGRRARALGFALGVMSNGFLIDDRAADTLAELGASVDVSLYALDESTFAAITGVAGALGRVCEGVRRLRARGVGVHLKVPVTSLNPHAPAQVLALAREWGCEATAFGEIYGRRDGCTETTRLQEEECHLTALFCHERSTVPEPPVVSSRPVDGPLCAAGTRHASIRADGVVLACSLLDVPAGDLRRQSFREIWERSPWLQTLRTLRVRDLGECADCELLAHCTRCHARALNETGTLGGKPEACCAAARARLAARAGCA